MKLLSDNISSMINECHVTYASRIIAKCLINNYKTANILLSFIIREKLITECFMFENVPSVIKCKYLI